MRSNTALKLVSTSGLAATGDVVAGKKTISPWKLVANGSWLSGQEFPLYIEGSILGRGKSCDITIPGTHLSRNHAELVVQNGQLLIKDLGSSNGTFLNNESVTEATAKPGDVLRMDVYSFLIEGPGKIANPKKSGSTSASGAHLSASQALENIKKLKKEEVKDYSETQWVTKPTSVGNRTHNVPSHGGADGSFWVSIVLGLAAVSALAYYFLA